MTEKRFKEIYPDIIRSNYCFTDNGEPIGDKEVCDLLNDLHEENQDLATKKEDAEYELLHLKEKYEELLKENEHIKHTIKTMIKTERTELGKSVLKQLWDNIME